jgi:hypothetical protein
MNNPMEAKRSQCFRKTVSSRGQQNIFTGRILRHSAWVSAILGKFKPQQRRLHPQDFVHAHVPRWFVLVHTLQRVQWNPWPDAGRSVINISKWQMVPGGSMPLITSTNSGQWAGLQGEVATGRQPRYPAPVLPEPGNMRLGYPNVGTAILAQVPSLYWTPTHTSSSPLPFLRLSRMQYGARYQELVVSDVISGEVGTRILRKLSRLEERPQVQPADSISSISGVRPNRDLVLETPGPRPLRESRAEDDLATPRSLPAPEINIGTIANEVMRQLDRGLIAARERRGRI